MTMEWEHLVDDTCTTVRLPFGLSAPREARLAMAAELSAARVRPAVIEDASLVLSEIVSNGIEHGQANDSGELEVSWCLREDHVLLSVVDSGQAITFGPREWSDHALGGRGLAIVDAICRNWAVETKKGLRVTAQLDFADAGRT
ncbi:hypothetical protein ASD11_01855 [Aeromicrobium sp. Root495]|uniref:ATP-binding protein n=1 Tax=Aeromicrobium sp. Root495 TaxID=1736550 RepID=UPI0006FAE557|nr:ATP-binding protein [Aeromicrobium sp. Root495]KQY58434.1 hypothetical protein ASD11_01855 [Aeromicrobium sp. Root495]